MKRVSKVKQLEQLYGKPLPLILRDCFEEYGSRAEVARCLGVSKTTVAVWLRSLGLRPVTRLVPAERPDYSTLFGERGLE